MKKIKSILIANRGEIACRIIETAKKLGIKTYVIKTAKEPNAVYTQLADVACDWTERTDEIPDFLDIEALINLAKEIKVDSIHPGYGFLAESPYFAKQCEDNGITYIGPSADAIYKMGNKTIAKQLATKHDVPLCKGSKSNLKTVKEAIKIAEDIGYPVILKAASGGGGRGMRIVEESAEMEKNFNLATNEAEKAFNDPSVFVEKYVRSPRHIEFQIFGDKHGNVVHLGERECSIQRKHQKLIEEAPSSALDADLRERMGKAAINIAKAVAYAGAGTVEFLLDDKNEFFFMEMNTRIQVEHPVTEMITGLDLVELQIKVAQGEKLPIKQKDVELKGWSIEFRINAEDVQANFSPNLGTIEKIKFPKGKNVRIDTGIQEGSAITPYYDSMILKLIITAEDRKKCIKSAITALKNLKIKGVKTTIPFHLKVMNNDAFNKGVFNTSFIETELDELFFQESDEEMLAAYFATLDFAQEVKSNHELYVDYNKGKELNPWVLNKRSKSL